MTTTTMATTTLPPPPLSNVALIYASFPPYPGFPTAAMRPLLAEWESSNSKDTTENWDEKRAAEAIRLWRLECEAHHCQGLLNAV
jgi:hypothetical protein